MTSASDAVQAQTFAYLDLETTGLLQPNQPPPRITEIALVALHRHEFLAAIRDVQEKRNGPGTEASAGTIDRYVAPRIVNKILQAINPEMQITYNASKISGLYTKNLSQMPTFSAFAPTFWAFLDHLPKPVCLIAHNGDRFDFPILKNELARANSLPSNGDGIFCADSITLFRNLDNRWIREYRASRGAGTSGTKEELVETVQNMEPSSGANGSGPHYLPGNLDVAQQESSSITSDGLTYRYRFISISGSPGSDYETSPSRPVSNDAASNGAASNGYSGSQPRNGSEQVRRQLFPSPPSAKERILSLVPASANRFGSYTLKAVHQRFFDGSDPPAHHSAEGDCLSLLQISAQYEEEFAAEVDAVMKPLGGIRQL